MLVCLAVVAQIAPTEFAIKYLFIIILAGLAESGDPHAMFLAGFDPLSTVLMTLLLCAIYVENPYDGKEYMLQLRFTEQDFKKWFFPRNVAETIAHFETLDALKPENLVAGTAEISI